MKHPWHGSPPTDMSVGIPIDVAAAVSAACAAKSAGWQALRDLRDGLTTRTAARSQMLEADTAAAELRAVHFPGADRVVAIGDRGVRQPFELYVTTGDSTERVWAEATA